VVSSAGTTAIAYGHESRITSISGPGVAASYAYNGLDTRVSKVENNVPNTFLRNGAYVTDSVLKYSGASYTPGIWERRGSTTTFMHSGLKNMDAQTNGSGAVSASRTYDAFGLVTEQTGSHSGPFGYAGAFGYQEDATGLKLLGHRYYDPSTGRFLTRDPIKDGRNWYAYGAGSNSPTTGADPTGLGWHDPAQVTVSPNFPGKVIIVGEPGKGKKPVFGYLSAGQTSHPGMDVDYVIVVMPDGTQKRYFLLGTGYLNPGNNPNFFYIDEEGNISGDGFIKPYSGGAWGAWIDPRIEDAKKRPIPSDRRPGGTRPGQNLGQDGPIIFGPGGNTLKGGRR
jgi:RHS repeat-associated protein